MTAWLYGLRNRRLIKYSRYSSWGVRVVGPPQYFRGMDGFTEFFGQDGGLHQVTRTGHVVNDLSTGRSAFVISEDSSTSLVSDDRGKLHQFLKNGSVTTDLSTGKTYFEI